ncbi:MAG: tRNA 2-thiocytidine(32) synthetase TtcA [bacterium]|nr:tRNA 2-thiocytidine(32) synthetase TtcA [bacterium]
MIQTLKKTRKIVGKAINKYNLIEAGDRVAIALSGGKDSLVLLETLAERRKYIPIDYDLLAVHIDITSVPYAVDRDFLTAFCDGLGVPFYFEKIEAHIIDPENEQSTCFLCSRKRRNELFKFCNTHNCNKLAFGHHMDDAIETLLMNMTFQGSISTMPPELSLFNGDLRIIRPLILLAEKEVKRYMDIRGLPLPKKECPYSDTTKRHAMKGIVSELEGFYQGARKNIYKAMSNVQSDYLPPQTEKLT